MNVWNPFKSKQGNRPPCRYQEGRRGSKQVVPGTSVFPSNETGQAGAEPALGACARHVPRGQGRAACLGRTKVHGIFQARILEWVAISFSRGSS